MTCTSFIQESPSNLPKFLSQLPKGEDKKAGSLLECSSRYFALPHLFFLSFLYKEPPLFPPLMKPTSAYHPLTLSLLHYKWKMASSELAANSGLRDWPLKSSKASSCGHISMEGKEVVIMKHGSLVMKLPPGFRFHPTDEELVVQYLKRKAFSFPLPASIIPEIDLCNYNPWDLPSGERYFFNLRERKFEAKRIRGFMMMNQTTKSGYWKPTGKEKPVFNSRGQEVVGSKQVLVFYRGKPHHGSKTDWIMHEYRLNEPIKFLDQSKEWVVCQIFEKRRYMKLKARIITSRHVPATSATISSESCITDISDDEDSVNGEEAMSRN